MICVVTMVDYEAVTLQQELTVAVDSIAKAMQAGWNTLCSFHHNTDHAPLPPPLYLSWQDADSGFSSKAFCFLVCTIYGLSPPLSHKKKPGCHVSGAQRPEHVMVRGTGY
jgi:hypothetical protein